MPGNFGSLMACDDDDEEAPEELHEDGVLFYVNKGGFPINEFTWDRMWSHVSKIHPDGLSMVQEIRGSSTLPDIAVPQAPLNFPVYTSIPDRLEMVQKYMNDLQYNHTGTQFYEIRKSRPLTGLMDTAKEMIREALPIKCLEAIILGIYLTNGMTGVDRFSISFKSRFSGNTHRHVVLGVCYNCRYGALGMSRRQDLMYKPAKFSSLSKLIINYKRAYEKYFHEVKKIKVGLPIPHDSHSYEQIMWKGIAIDVGKTSEEDLIKSVDKHAREIRVQVHNHNQVEQALAKTKPSTAPAQISQPHAQPTSRNTTSSKHHRKNKSKTPGSSQHRHDKDSNGASRTRASSLTNQDHGASSSSLSHKDSGASSSKLTDTDLITSNYQIRI